MTTHRLLFDLRIKHEFYANGQCRDVEVVPSEERLKYRAPQADPKVLETPPPPEVLEGGARALARRQLVAKTRPDGVEVFARCREDAPVVSFDGVSITFALRARNPQFPSFTQLSLGPPSSSWRRARPTWVTSEDTNVDELVLGTGEAVVPPGVLGYAEIRDVSSDWVASPRHLTISFVAVEARWIYYVVKTGDPLASPPKLVEDEGRLTFAAAVLDPPAMDPIASQLADRYPTAQRFRLSSEDKVSCRADPGYRLRLDFNGQTDPNTISDEPPLALPSLRDISKLELSPDDPEQCFYQVVTL